MLSFAIYISSSSMRFKISVYAPLCRLNASFHCLCRGRGAWPALTTFDQLGNFHSLTPQTDAYAVPRACEVRVTGSGPGGVIL
jgi:hypothetical protein